MPPATRNFHTSSVPAALLVYVPPCIDLGPPDVVYVPPGVGRKGVCLQRPRLLAVYVPPAVDYVPRLCVTCRGGSV